MIVDITNEVLSKLKNELTNVTVLPSYPDKPPKFPVVIVRDMQNISVGATKDTAGFNHSDVSIEFQIFTKGSKKMSDAKVIRNDIDKILSDEYGMNRVYSDEVPNYTDRDVYRYVLRYNGIIDENKLIYGR